MNESRPLTAGIEAPDAEVELSAEDLLALSIPGESKERAPEPLAKITTAAAVPSAPAFQKRAASKTVRRNVWPARVAASVIFAVGSMGALYFVMASNDGASRSMAQGQAPQSQLPAAAPTREAEPVLFANPFDANEVFEFPAGTSKAEARDAVAEILMERAMKRQRQFDARVSSNR
jgi:hypothetical protein